MNSALPSLFRYVIVAAVLVAAYFSALFARASFLFDQNTPASVPAAVQLVPYNSSYIARLAAWQPERRILLLHRAVELNPFDYESWIQLGLLAEMQEHDTASAERYYLRAAQVDHMFLPKWTLTNFYFRQQKRDEFFHWARATLSITPYQADPVFTQMWLMSQEPNKIAQAIPDRPGVLLQYANFLTNAHQYAAVPAIVDRLVAAVGSRNPTYYGRDDQIGPMEDRILSVGDLESALEIWKALDRGQWVGLPAPTPAHPLTNGDFHRTFFRHGFDWIPMSESGLSIEQFPNQKILRLTLSGTEPENGILLAQYVPLQPNRPYRLQWNADTRGIEQPSGFAWHLRPVANSNQGDLASGDLLDSSSARWDFKTPSAGLYLLDLEYKRPLGTMRAAGTIELKAVSLQQQ